ncbi:hypothetical protein GmHk_10G028265 [Glycine max]|nr:hypothetical protein GmHk_10G028265 [Glycine max]
MKDELDHQKDSSLDTIEQQGDNGTMWEEHDDDFSICTVEEQTWKERRQRGISFRIWEETGIFIVSYDSHGLGSSSSMDSFASWKMNGSGMEKEEREETPLQGEDESRRSSPP